MFLKYDTSVDFEKNWEIYLIHIDPVLLFGFSIGGWTKIQFLRIFIFCTKCFYWLKNFCLSSKLFDFPINLFFLVLRPFYSLLLPNIVYPDWMFYTNLFFTCVVCQLVDIFSSSLRSFNLAIACDLIKRKFEKEKRELYLHYQRKELLFCWWGNL